MTKLNNVNSLSQVLQSITIEKQEDESISLLEINAILHERGFALLMILFSFPMAIPLPYPPGFTTILGIPLMFYSILMILGKKNPWLPEFIAKRSIKISHLNFAITKTVKFFNFVNRVTKPRLLFMSGLHGEKFIGVIALLCSISIILPIWFGNAVPSLGILIMSLGLLFCDGIVIIIGILTSIFGLFIAGAVVVFGVTMVKSALGMILNFIS